MGGMHVVAVGEPVHAVVVADAEVVGDGVDVDSGCGEGGEEGEEESG